MKSALNVDIFIDWDRLCNANNTDGCNDGSDESKICETACRKSPCQQRCIPSPSSPVCSCSLCSMLKNDKITCKTDDLIMGLIVAFSCISIVVFVFSFLASLWYCGIKYPLEYICKALCNYREQPSRDANVANAEGVQMALPGLAQVSEAIIDNVAN